MPKKTTKRPADWVETWCKDHGNELAEFHRNRVVTLHPDHGILNSAFNIDQATTQSRLLKRSVLAEVAYVSVEKMLQKVGWRDPKLPPKRKIWEPPPGWTPPTAEELKAAMEEGRQASESFRQKSLSPPYDPEDEGGLIDGGGAAWRRRQAEKEELPVVDVPQPTSESLPREAKESPHKQPPFQPRKAPWDRGVVLDGYGRTHSIGRGRVD